ncbi:hypothetical protein [Arsenophonus endosymbiont of Aleurodicus floccissimus]|uniref:hypothetical protein n=1 Tax=Arsenophonus endosymbiont of Aleurodicus floccissimus TaxID=2152761 RepID=UPI000E6B120A|nr:hypothetical protein [Arsenophonus endosymbiont of Aleurodicus floccissimus]
MISSLQSASVNNIESFVASSPDFDPIKVEINKKIDNKFVLVFSGFSGMGFIIYLSLPARLLKVLAVSMILLKI